jgi:hypothetical protein
VKPRTLLVLLVLVLGLGAFIWFYERELPSSEERAKLAKRVLAVEAGDVESVAIEWQGRKVRLERDPAPKDGESEAEADAEPGEAGEAEAPAPEPAERAWRLTEPLQALADRFAVERLVESLTGLDKERTLEDPDRADLGLESPRARVTLGTADGETVLEIGAEVPASSSMIVAVAGEPVAHAVAKHLYADLTKEPGDWRSRDLFTAQRDDIERLTLAGPGGRVLLAKRGDGFWIESPIVDRADRDHANELLGQITGLRVHAFLDAPALSPAEMGLEPPRGLVEAILRGSEQPFRIEVGAADPESAERRYARLGSLLFTTEAKLGEALERGAEQWRALGWSGVEVYQIDAAKTSGSGEPLALKRAGADWQRGEVKIAYTPVSDFLYAVAGAKGEAAMSPAAAAELGATLAAPALEIALTASDGREETLRLFAPLADGRVPATASGRDVVLLLSASAASDVQSKLAAVRQAEPLAEGSESEGDDEAATPEE